MEEQEGVESFKVARQLGHDPDEIVAYIHRIAPSLGCLYFHYLAQATQGKRGLPSSISMVGSHGNPCLS
jgi:hypothetical protein